jgi:hypothetical protein
VALTVASSHARAANAQCCTGYSQQCAGPKARWCVASGAPANALPQSFCDYGEKIISSLEMLFNLPEQGQFEFDVEFPTSGGAHTGTACGTYGDTVTGDAFTNVGYDVPGFWGYMLSLHEAINVWTASFSSGWPTDYWADHVSGFPLSTDWHVMATIGLANSDMNLTASSAALHSQYENGDSRIQMFDNIFALPNMGYTGYSRAFGYVQGDRVGWDDLGVPNPDQKRSEYVVAYVSLAAGQSVLPIMQAANICSGMPDTNAGPACSQPGCPGVAQLPVYACSEADIAAIANAHCAIAANGNPASDLAALQAGNYAGVVPGPCGPTCPSECGCDMSSMHCVAPWVAGNGGPDGSTAPPRAVAVVRSGAAPSPASPVRFGASGALALVLLVVRGRTRGQRPNARA